MSEDSDRRVLIVKVPEGLHRRLKVIAARAGRTMQDLVLEAVQATVEIQESDHRPATEGAGAETGAP